MSFKEKIRESLAKIDPKKMYSVPEIVDLGVIVNAKLESFDYKIYRLIRNGELPAVNLGSEKMARWTVEGNDLINYVTKKYQLSNE